MRAIRWLCEGEELFMTFVGVVAVVFVVALIGLPLLCMAQMAEHGNQLDDGPGSAATWVPVSQPGIHEIGFHGTARVAEPGVGHG